MVDQSVATLPEIETTAVVVRHEARSDEHLISLWLHGRSVSTRRAYAADIASFTNFIRLPLRSITLGDVQAYQDSLAEQSSASQARRLSVVKSLLSFGQRTGYLTINVGAAVRLPKVKQAMAERILGEDDVLHMLRLERNPRNKTMLRLLYLAGLRISELCDLKVRDLQPRDDSGQITIFGKGGKTRVVLLKATIWADLAMMRGHSPDDAVFRSREGGGPLDPSQVHRIVKIAANWLRHAHVSHALDRGAPAHLVQQTVGHASLATTSRYAHARPSDSSSRYLPG
jgi:integrase/recombinase XerD